MISFLPSGGLGNQLFQIFSTISYALDTSMDFVFPTTRLFVDNPPRPMYWDSFLKQLEPYTTKHAWPHDVPTIYNTFELVCEKAHTYDKLPTVDRQTNYAIKGYFQSWKYFDEHKTDICNMIGIDQFRDNLRHVLPKNTHTISMHFRMGDYKQKRCYHPVLPIEYYADALRDVLSSSKYKDAKTHCVVCFFESDDEFDVNKALSYMYTLPEFVRVEFRKAPSDLLDWEQLMLMSCCDDHIIANSTFSWWGAYFNPSSTKIVCYPGCWYGHQLYYISTKDMFPPNWTVVSPRYIVECHCAQSEWWLNTVNST